MKYLRAFYRLSVACWLGGAALFTFVLTPAIFSAYDRDQAGAIVGHLFPGYFRWGLAWGLLALASALLTDGVLKKTRVGLLAAMLAITSFQAFYVEPKAAEIKKRIPSFETTPVENPLRQEFRRLHGASSAGNLAVIAGGAVLVILL